MIFIQTSVLPISPHVWVFAFCFFSSNLAIGFRKHQTVPSCRTCATPARPPALVYHLYFPGSGNAPETLIWRDMCPLVHGGLGGGAPPCHGSASWDSRLCCMALWDDGDDQRVFASNPDLFFPHPKHFKSSFFPPLQMHAHLSHTNALLFACECAFVCWSLRRERSLRGHSVFKGSIVTMCALNLHSSDPFQGSYITNRSAADPTSRRFPVRKKCRY